jgi:hypothetical protein
MKKLTLALVVGVMYLGTQATVVFAEPKVGERDTCPTCGIASNKGDAKQQEVKPEGGNSAKPADSGSKEQSSGLSARDKKSKGK